MKTLQTADDQRYRTLVTSELRRAFMIEDLFSPGCLELRYTDVDRAVVGGIVPLAEPLRLEGGREMACAFFCERREVGVISLAGKGVVTVDGREFPVSPRECVYIGRG